MNVQSERGEHQVFVDEPLFPPLLNFCRMLGSVHIYVVGGNAFPCYFTLGMEKAAVVGKFTCQSRAEAGGEAMVDSSQEHGRGKRGKDSELFSPSFFLSLSH